MCVNTFIYIMNVDNYISIMHMCVCHSPSCILTNIELLCVQFEKYYAKESDIIPPVKLDPCISASGGEIHKLEPVVRT